MHSEHFLPVAIDCFDFNIFILWEKSSRNELCLIFAN
jgi:hypothetical protein